MNLARNKLNNENYNVETYYSSSQMKSLAHYKRILTRKLYNPTYLTKVENDDLVFQVHRILFGKCPVCIDCDIPDLDTTTSTTMVPGTTTSTTTNTL